jgi:inward rectifier potassium channel
MLMLRVGNERRSRVIDAKFRLSVTRTTKTAEGVTIYRTVDLPLIRDHATALSRAWNVMHVITPGSPLEGATAESLAATEAEINLLLTGTDDTSLQPVHGLYTWLASDVVFGHRLADIVSDLPDGNMLIDLARFHDVVPVSPAAAGG